MRRPFSRNATKLAQNIQLNTMVQLITRPVSRVRIFLTAVMHGYVVIYKNQWCRPECRPLGRLLSLQLCEHYKRPLHWRHIIILKKFVNIVIRKLLRSYGLRYIACSCDNLLRTCSYLASSPTKMICSFTRSIWSIVKLY